MILGDDAPIEVVIEPPDDENAKGRSFSAIMMCWVTASSLWEGGDGGGDTHRPVYAVLGATKGMAPSIKANLRLGRKCETPKQHSYGREKSDRWEFLRSADYEFRDQQPDGTDSIMLQAFLPKLIRIDGDGMIDTKKASFVMIPTKHWADKQKLDEAAVLAHLELMKMDLMPKTMERYLPAAACSGALFTAYLARRTRCPIPADQRLYAQILVAAVDQGLAAVSLPDPDYYGDETWGRKNKNKAIGYTEHGIERCGLLHGVAFNTTHEVLEPFLAHQVDRFLRKAK